MLHITTTECKMSGTAEDLLIIYEEEAEQWNAYLKSIFAGPVGEAGICCYNISDASSRRGDLLQLGRYRCKLLILSRGMLEGLCQMRRFLLARALQPAGSVVVLLCGVESLEPFLDAVPLEKGYQQISSQQDAQDYVSAVVEIVTRGEQVAPSVGTLSARVAGLELSLEKRQSVPPAERSTHLIPSRVPCENPGEVFILLREALAGREAEVEFTRCKQKVRVRPVVWNKHTLCVKAPDFPAGAVGVTVHCGGAPSAKVRLQYYSTMGEVALLLRSVVDPLEFMRQAFQVSSAERLDQMLASVLTEKMPAGGFLGLESDESQEATRHSEDLPTLLHFAAQNGLRDVASVLLQCPGAARALHMANQHGETPLRLAERHGHTQLHILLREALTNSGEHEEDSSVYEMMGSTGNNGTDQAPEEEQVAREDDEEEDPYAPLGGNDEEYDTIFNSCKSVIIANRPPAPTPRPETIPTKEDNMPYIAQVFQKKSQRDTDTLYSLPAKQAKGQGGISPTYDTFVTCQPPGLEELIQLQEKVKRGLLTMDEALERFSDWQRVQKGLDVIQQEKLRQLRASIIKNREDDDNIYDKINIVHHTPDVTANEYRRVSQPAEAEFYSKPIKGQRATELAREACPSRQYCQPAGAKEAGRRLYSPQAWQRPGNCALPLCSPGQNRQITQAGLEPRFQGLSHSGGPK